MVSNYDGMGRLVIDHFAKGLVRYFVVQASLVTGMFPVARVTPVFIGVNLTALVTVVFWLLVTGQLEFT